MPSIAQKLENNSASLIKAKRTRLRMTQKELADAVGMSKFGDRTIRRWENGESKPSVIELNHILSFPETIPFPNLEKAPFRTIDLFAGIGGIRLGFYKTNKTRVVFSSEIDKFAIKTYKANFGDTPSGDITKIDENEIPEHDILLAGFPCQAFSQAGKKLGFDDTRGTLFFDIARIIKAKRPRAFMLENVKNLKSHDRGKTYETIMNTLKALDYDVRSVLYRAKDFGLPQNRERIYLIGFDKKTVKNYADYNLPIPPCNSTSLADILEKNVDEKYTISDKLWAGHKRRKNEHIKKGNGFGFSIFNENSAYTNTLSARYYKDGSEILIEQNGKNPRKLTPREAARLQGFPENFVIPVSDTQSYKQFGNSVAVNVISKIAKSILEVLENEYLD